MNTEHVDDFPVVLQKSYWLQSLLLILITVTATILRFYKLGEWSFWIDEIYTIRTALAAAQGNAWPQLSFTLTGYVINAFGISEWSSRLVAAVIGILTIPILYIPIKRLFGSFVALIALLLLALSPWHLYWSQNARFYTMLLLLYTLAALFLYMGVESRRWWAIIVAAVLLFLAVGEREIALFLIPVVMVYGGIVTFQRLRSRGSLSFTLFFRFSLPVALTFAVWMYLDPDTISRLIDIFFGRSNHGPFRLLLSIVYRMGIPLVCLAAVGGYYSLLRYNKAGLFILLGAMVPVVLLVAMSPFAFTVDRYVFATLPNWVILGAVTIKELFDQTKGHGKLLACGVLLVLLSDSLSQNLLYYDYHNGNRPDWRGAVTVITQRKADGDLIATTRPELVHYYSGDESENVIDLDQLDPQEIMRIDKRIWFIEDQDWADPSLQQWVRENCTLIDVRDVYIPGKNLTMRVYLYDPLTRRSNTSPP